MGDWRGEGGGGRKRPGAATLLRSVAVFFAAGHRGTDRHRPMSAKEAKGAPANMMEVFKKRTHFSRQEMESLCGLYHKLVRSPKEEYQFELSPQLRAIAAATSPLAASQRKCEVSGGGVAGLDRPVFRNMLYNTFGVVAEDEVLLDRIFCTFDTANDGVISLQEWVLALSVFLKGTLAERAGFTFSVYDLNNDGYIVKDEMLHWLRNSLVKQPQDEDPDEGVKDLVDMVLKRLDLDRDGKVSKEDFLGAVAEEPLFLEAFGQCLPTEAAAAAFLMTLAP